RLPAVPPLPDHRSRRRLRADVDGHDDAAACDDLAALQADLLRAGRRLVAGGGEPGAELRGVISTAIMPHEGCRLARHLSRDGSYQGSYRVILICRTTGIVGSEPVWSDSSLACGEAGARALASGKRCVIWRRKPSRVR